MVRIRRSSPDWYRTSTVSVPYELASPVKFLAVRDGSNERHTIDDAPRHVAPSILGPAVVRVWEGDGDLGGGVLRASERMQGGDENRREQH